MVPNWSEEKIEILGVQGRKQVLVFSRIPDADTEEPVECLRIQEMEKPK